jgi:general secretion pathway protein M
MTDTARKLQNWFLALSRREQWLVGIAAILTMFVIGFYLVTRPMLNAIDAKRAEYFVALERRAAIVSQVNSALNEKVGAGSIPAGSVQQLISQSAVDAGFVLDRADARGADEVEFTISKAKPAAFMVWLGDWETRGILARNLDVKASADGTIAVTATLARQAR